MPARTCRTSVPISISRRRSLSALGTRSATFTTPEGEKRTIKGELKIDDKARPKTIDWVKFKAPDGEDLPDNLAIYELDGDTFKVCNGGPNNPRPTELKAGDEGPPNLMIFKRQKDETPAKGAE